MFKIAARLAIYLYLGLSLAGCGVTGLYESGTSAPLTIVTAFVPSATAQRAYNAPLIPQGGMPPYSWMVASGQLPVGISLNGSSGVISGSPSEMGRFSFTISVSDSTGHTGTRNFEVTVLDQFGGFSNVTSPSGGTGFFRVEKFGNRWMFVTPEGHGFWMKAIQSFNFTDGGTTGQNAVIAKYGDAQSAWGNQATMRAASWGFNAVGEYASRWVLPMGMFGAATGNATSLPFIRFMRVTPTAMNSTNKVKNIVFGTSTSAYDGWRGDFPDVYDPNFAAVAQTVSSTTSVTGGMDAVKASPWILGTTMDDNDDLFGFKTGIRNAPFPPHAHLGWITAITAPTQTANGSIQYTDTTVYSKRAWSNYLQNKYLTVTALNAAWDSAYTTFGSNGGWGTGTGVLDEDGLFGRAWLGKGFVELTDANPTTKADLDFFLEWRIAETYFKTLAGAVRTADPNHLVFSPDTLFTLTRPEVLRAAARHCDVIQLSGIPFLATGYDAVAQDKPIFIYRIIKANADSPYAPFANTTASTDLRTQEQRGQQYASDISTLLNFQATNGSKPIIGMDWWSWTDKNTQGEHDNFGLVTVLDNAYNGKEGVIAAGTDPWGFRTGGESANYGDFLSAVQTANQSVVDTLDVANK